MPHSYKDRCGTVCLRHVTFPARGAGGLFAKRIEMPKYQSKTHTNTHIILNYEFNLNITAISLLPFFSAYSSLWCRVAFVFLTSLHLSWLQSLMVCDWKHRVPFDVWQCSSCVWMWADSSLITMLRPVCGGMSEKAVSVQSTFLPQLSKAAGPSAVTGPWIQNSHFKRSHVIH